MSLGGPRRHDLEFQWANCIVDFTGGVTFGGIDTSKFTGKLVQVPNVIQEDQIGVYVAKPNITINGITFVPDQDTNCLVDSGSHADALPFYFGSNLTSDFIAASGGQLIEYAGIVGFNGSCDEIPKNANITYTFAGSEPGETVSVAVPLRNYARGALGPYMAPEGFNLNLEVNSCLFGAPFSTAAFLGLDDEDQSIWLAQGA